MKYIKANKPVEARQVTKESFEEVCIWLGDQLIGGMYTSKGYTVSVKHPGGHEVAREGDWIVNTKWRQFRVVEKATFESLYTPEDSVVSVEEIEGVRIDGETVKAIKELVGEYALGDMICDVREKTLGDEGYEGESWEHPKVKRFSEIVGILGEV